MGTSLDTDWDTIKTLYCSGMRPQAIAERFNVKPGTIYQRATRGNWKAIATKTSEIASQTTPADIGGMVNHWVDRLNRACVGHLEQLETKPKKTLKDLKEAAETLKLLGETQYKNLGRDAESNTLRAGVVNITLVSEAYQKPAQAIPIESEPIRPDAP